MAVRLEPEQVEGAEQVVDGVVDGRGRAEASRLGLEGTDGTTSRS